MEKVLSIADVKLLPIHVACSSDDFRPNGALIEIRNNIAIATNFHVLVNVDLKIASALTNDMLEVLNGKYIHKEVWKQMHKCDELYIDDHFIYVTKNGIKQFFEFSTPQGEFFKIDSIVREIKEAGEDAKKAIKINPELVKIIAKAFNADQLNFSFSPNNKGYVVFPSEGCGMFAILMPMTEIEPRYLFLNELQTA